MFNLNDETGDDRNNRIFLKEWSRTALFIIYSKKMGVRWCLKSIEYHLKSQQNNAYKFLGFCGAEV